MVSTRFQRIPGYAVKFSFSQVEAALAQCHSIADDKRSAFANRLKHLQKNGFPPGTKTGRGVAAEYNIGHVLQLAFVLEFNQLGLLPERSAHTVTSNLDTIHRAVGQCVGYRGIKEEEVFLSFDPSNLIDLMNPLFTDPVKVSFWYYETEAVQGLFGQWKTPRAPTLDLPRRGRRLAFINVTQLILLLVSYLAGGAHTEKDIIRAMALWDWRASK